VADARAAVEGIAADDDGAVVAATTAGGTGGALVVRTAGEVAVAENGVQPARASTRRAIPLRVRRIHPE
jgi:hypothetical protein